MTETTNRPIDVRASGPVNGMGEADPEGSYICLSIISPNGSVWNFRISHGAAQVLKAEIAGALENANVD
jgi:hypothetical protein